MSKRRPVPVVLGLSIFVMVASPVVGVVAAAQPAQAETSTTSARHLLNGLTVRAESHSGSYSRTKFRHWIDADRDGEDTRAEVLRAESSLPIRTSRTGTVLTGKWRSPYDGKVVTRANQLDVDHLVPLKEAWTSGASGWSAQKREAYANDVAYGPSLIAVTKHENRRAGDREPTTYLPPKKSYRCTYVRNWIAVKARWHLSVDKNERRVLVHDLGKYCSSLSIRKPSTPVVATLVGASRPIDTSKPVHTAVPAPVTPPAAVPAPTPVESAAPVPAPIFTPLPSPTSTPLYANCAAAPGPLFSGQPGYSRDLDGDGDGIACEADDPRAAPAPTPTYTWTPAPAPTHPSGATAVCRDGSYSYSPTRSGTCAGHGGVRTWF